MPFFANHGYHPKLDLLNPPANNHLAAEGFVKQLFELQAALKLQLQAAQESYKASANKFRNEAPTYKVGDKAWLL